MEQLSLNVENHEQNLRIDKFLADRMPEQSR